MDLSLHSKVYCTDGPCGHSTYAILSPATDQVTHLVVEDEQTPHTEHLVPLKLIGDIKPGTVLLSCNRAALAKQDRFVETQYIRVETLVYDKRLQRYVLLPDIAWRASEE